MIGWTPLCKPPQNGRRNVSSRSTSLRSDSVTRPTAWAFALAAVGVAILVTISYVGGFLDPGGTGQGLPIAIVDVDAGATAGTAAVRFGDQVVAQATAPDSPLGSSVRWVPLGSRDEALAALGANRVYAAVVIPPGYSAQVVALLVPAREAAPATIEVLTNPAAGSLAGAESQQLATGLVRAVSIATNARIVQSLQVAGVRVAPESAAIIGDPVQPTVTVAQPIGAKSGRGLAPFYFAVMLAISAYMAVSIVSYGVDVLIGELSFDLLAWRIRRPPLARSRVQLWRAKLRPSIGAAVVIGLATTWVAVGPLGMSADRGFRLALFASLAVVAITAVVLAFQTAFGQVGLVLAVMVAVIYAVPASGGVYPPERVPALFRGLRWLPLRYVVDGARALMFFDGRRAAGLGTAVWALSAYALGATAAGWLAAAAIDRQATARDAQTTAHPPIPAAHHPHGEPS